MELIDILKKIGFTPEEGKIDSYIINIKNYSIRIEMKDDKIDYGNKIVVYKEDAKNTKIPENIVRLECIIRLLRKGYRPEDIELEKTYKLGHKYKGYADIVISNNKKSFIIIECKKDLNELEKEKENMLIDGGQLISYYQQDKNVELMVLYSTTFENSKYISYVLPIIEDFRLANSVEEIFNRWNKQFNLTGIFEDEFSAYNIFYKPLSHSDLEDLTERDSKIIFNQFQEILRHNVISDKPNAFNKMMNLFLCKIVDEFETTKVALDFQWLKNDTPESFMTRLNDLYKKGMLIYFQKTLIDYSEEDIYRASGNDPKLIQIFNDLRLKKNNEFAFKEVFDNKTFEENTLIVKEAVELLQKKRIRYSYKQQFLGDFFELLLNTSIKQEAGQFFTPIPIVRFILRSLPVIEIINNKIKNGDSKILPYTIDYAAGTGHFLTETMDWYDYLIKNIIKSNPLLNEYQIDDIRSWCDNRTQYKWANEFVYGIEKDYRLIKSAKVSCFLNGDGDAVIINGDGLDNFRDSVDYKGKLKICDERNSKLNEQFDIVVANPPYSVNAFKNYLKQGSESFELFSRLTTNSSEIECLFIERTFQLLKEGGVAGIILPASVLSNGKIYTDTRNVLLKRFDIISIVSLGENTFMETGTNTIIMFLRKKSGDKFDEIKLKVKNLLNSSKITDITVNGIDHAVSKYLKDVYNELLSIEEYNDFLKNKKDITGNEITTKYKNCSIDEILQYEIEKMSLYLSVYNGITIIANTGTTKEEQIDFLGYFFSKRRKYEGMHKRENNEGKMITKLYDDDNLYEETKLNYCIYNNFIGNEFEIDPNLSNNVNTYNLKDLIEFGSIGKDFISKISTTPIDKFKINSKYSIKKLEGLLIGEPISGSTPSKNNVNYWNSDEIPWVTLEDFKDTLFLNSSIKYVSKQAVTDRKVRLVPKGCVLMSCTATLGKIAINNFECTTNQQINALICDEKQILPEYLAYYLSSSKSHLYYVTNNLGVKHINLQILKNLQIIVPPIEIQEEIIKSVKDDVENIGILDKKIMEREQLIKQTISVNLTNNYLTLEEICGVEGIKIGGTPASYEYKYYHNGDKLWVKISDLNNDVVYNTTKKINDLGVKNSNVKLIKNGSTLVSFKLSIGKVAIAGADLYTNEAIMGLDPLNEIDNKYLFYIFKYKFVDMNADQKAFGKSLNLPLIKKLMIPYIQTDDTKIQLIEFLDKCEEEIKGYKRQIEKTNIKILEEFEKSLMKV